MLQNSPAEDGGAMPGAARGDRNALDPARVAETDQPGGGLAPSPSISTAISLSRASVKVTTVWRNAGTIAA
jgi:hypothetical protein